MVTPLTVARVPTGMKTGVSTGPCAVWKRPRRAEVAASRARSSKSKRVMRGIVPDGTTLSLRALHSTGTLVVANHPASPHVQRSKMPDRPTDDAALLAAADEGDLDAFEALVRAHTRVVYAHALRFFGDPTAAEDTVQEVWIKVYRSLANFDGRARFSTWLYRVDSKHLSRPGPRRRAAARSRSTPSTRSPCPVTLPTRWRSPPPSNRPCARSLPRTGTRSRRSRSTASTYAEVAETLRVPVGTVKSRVFRARRCLGALPRHAGRAVPRWTATTRRRHLRDARRRRHLMPPRSKPPSSTAANAATARSSCVRSTWSSARPLPEPPAGPDRPRDGRSPWEAAAERGSRCRARPQPRWRRAAARTR